MPTSSVLVHRFYWICEPTSCRCASGAIRCSTVVAARRSPWAMGLDRTVHDALVAACVGAVEANVVILDEAIYSALEGEARDRSLRDPSRLGRGRWLERNPSD